MPFLSSALYVPPPPSPPFLADNQYGKSLRKHGQLCTNKNKLNTKLPELRVRNGIYKYIFLRCKAYQKPFSFCLVQPF